MYITLGWQMVLCHGLEKTRIMLVFWFCFRLKKMMLVSDNEQLTLFPTCSIFFVRSFDFNDRSHLTYEDVLFGVAAMDLSTPHGGPSGELRCRYIFKFYSTEEEASLSFEEFK